MGYFWDDFYLRVACADQTTWQGWRDKVVAASGSSQPCTPALCCGSFPLCTPASPPLALCPPLHDSIIPGKEGPLPKKLPWICGTCSWPKGKGWRALRRSGTVRSGFAWERRPLGQPGSFSVQARELFSGSPGHRQRWSSRGWCGQDELLGGDLLLAQHGCRRCPLPQGTWQTAPLLAV